MLACRRTRSSQYFGSSLGKYFCVGHPLQYSLKRRSLEKLDSQKQKQRYSTTLLAVYGLNRTSVI